MKLGHRYRFRLQAAGLLAACCLVVNCSKNSASSGPTFETSPKVVINVRNPTVVVSFTTNKPVKAHYRLVGNSPNWEHTSSDYRHEHLQALAGLPIGKTHRVSIAIVDEDGRRTEIDTPLDIAVPSVALSVGTLPRLELLTDSSIQGITVLSLNRLSDLASTNSLQQSGSLDQTHGLVLAIDQALNIVWYFETDYRVEGVEQTAPDTLTLVSAGGRETVDFLGNRTKRWRGERQGTIDSKNGPVLTIAADSLHSNAVQLPDGNQLILTTELRLLKNHPPHEAKNTVSSLASKETAVVGDVVVEVTPKGEIIGRWNLFDLLDSTRYSRSAENSSHLHIYPTRHAGSFAQSWTQANGIAYDAHADTILISLRQQAAIVGIGKSQANLKWILSDPSGWQKPWSDKLLRPAAEGEGRSITWPDSPSAMMLTERGDVLLIDDGTARAALYRVDEAAMRVQAVGEYTLNAYFESNDRDAPMSMVGIPGTKDILIAAGLSGELIRLNESAMAASSVMAIRSEAAEEYRWVVTDVLGIEAIIPPSDIPIVNSTVPAAKPVTVAAVDGAVVAATTPSPKPDISLPETGVAGKWRSRVGSDPAGDEQELTLIQDGRLLEGAIDGFPIVAWVRGNTFSMTIRREGNLGQVRMRYRGVVVADGKEIIGNVSINRGAEKVGSFAWSARKQ